MEIIKIIIFFGFTISVVITTMYMLQLLLLFFAYNFKNKKQLKQENLAAHYPFITIQLPVYNEPYVIERAIAALANQEYPKDKFEIQILDDSTDSTSNIIKNSVSYFQKKQIQIHHIQRNNRIGFKAGALQHGLNSALGDYIAIFDADFLPDKYFLIQALPYFTHPTIGMVQCRWGHINSNQNLLTKLQSIALDVHFTIEQVGRNNLNAFINFNGTAGIWRKQCIIESGNWQHDTLTEDLDLSYRAQLKKWKFIYAENIVCNAELPPILSAIKSQQFRWNHGGTSCAKKHLKNLLQSKVNLKTKLLGACHLLNTTMYFNLFIFTILSLPMALLWKFSSNYLISFVEMLLLANTLILGITHFIPYQKKYSNWLVALPSYCYYFIFYLIVSLGLSLHNTKAVLMALMNKKMDFIRTPKFNTTLQNQLQNNTFIAHRLDKSLKIELIWFLILCIEIIYCIRLHRYILVAFHSFFAIGLLFIFYFTWQEIRLKKTNFKD